MRRRDRPEADGWQPAAIIRTDDAPTRSGRTFKAGWIRLSVEALKLRLDARRNFSDESPFAIAKKLDQLLIDNDQSQPAFSKLRQSVEQVFACDDNPLTRKRGKKGQ
jgi:hypothetical protein